LDRFANISAFVTVAESGGFRAAARRLDISVTMVSNHVQALEDSLGVRLLNRTTRRVSLTEIGREYYERSSLILQELREADAAASASQVSPRGLLRVYCHQGIAQYLAPVITGFLTRYPEVSLDLRTGDAMIDMLHERFDLAITAQPPADTTLVRRRLTGLRLVLACAPSYLERHPAPEHPSDLAAHNCLRYAYAITGDDWELVDARGNATRVRVSGNLITTSFETMRAAAIAGLGIWLMPPFIVGDLLTSGTLVQVLPDYWMPHLEVAALYPHRRHMTAKLRAFIDMLVDEIANAPSLADLRSR
jgi:DNA-binding transcriptional LysR family regulator